MHLTADSLYLLASSKLFKYRRSGYNHPWPSIFVLSARRISILCFALDICVFSRSLSPVDSLDSLSPPGIASCVRKERTISSIC